MIGFASKFLTFNSRMGFNFFFLILGMGLIVFLQPLRELVLVYAILYLLSEAFQAGIQASSTPFFKGALLFGVTTFISVLLFSSLSGLVEGGSFYDVENVGLVGWVLFFLYVAVVEEEVFRSMLPKAINNMLIPQFIYVAFHFVTISYLVTSVTLSSMLPYFAFTFLFACAMMYLTYMFKTTVPAIAVHWVYDLFKVGVLMSVLGWLI